MLKANDPGSLEKGSQALGNLFAREAADLGKSFSHQTKLAEHHEALKADHEKMEQEERDQAKKAEALHEGMGDDNELKASQAQKAAYHKSRADAEKSMASHHEGLAKEHRAHAEALKAQIDTMKTVAAEWGGHAIVKVASGGVEIPIPPPGEPGTGVAAMIAETTQALTKKALSTLDSDPAVQDKIREMVLKGVSEALGDKIIPDRVAGIVAPPGFRMVPRAGQQAPTGASVDPEFEKMVSVED